MADCLSSKNAHSSTFIFSHLIVSLDSCHNLWVSSNWSGFSAHFQDFCALSSIGQGFIGNGRQGYWQPHSLLGAIWGVASESWCGIVPRITSLSGQHLGSLAIANQRQFCTGKIWSYWYWCRFELVLSRQCDNIASEILWLQKAYHHIVRMGWESSESFRGVHHCPCEAGQSHESVDQAILYIRIIFFVLM